MYQYAPLPAVNHQGFGWLAEIFTGLVSLVGAGLQIDTMHRQRKSARHQRARDQYAEQLAQQQQQQLIDNMQGSGGVNLGPGQPAYGTGTGQQQQQKMPGWVLPAAIGGGGLLLLLVVLK